MGSTTNSIWLDWFSFLSVCARVLCSFVFDVRSPAYAVPILKVRSTYLFVAISVSRIIFTVKLISDGGIYSNRIRFEIWTFFK